MYQKLFQTIQKHNLIPPHTVIVVAVSGGADSLALLHLLRGIRNRLPCELHVATLDHGLRGEAGAADARFVADTAASWGLAVTVGRVSVPALMSQTGQGVEAAARQARYDFLAETAQATGAPVIASAHHADDEAETILLHLLRGAGLNGLRGMAYRARVPGYAHLTLIRPLLNVTRTEIDSYCREHGLVPREDASNQDVTLLRNRIRAEVLPRLREINPQIAQALISLADNAAVDQDYIASQFALVADACRVDEERVTIPRHLFATLPDALRRHFVRWASERLGNPETVGHLHIVQAVTLGMSGTVGAQLPLPGKLRLRIDYDAVILERLGANSDDAETVLLPPGAEIRLAIPGITPLPDGRWSVMVKDELSDDALCLSMPPESIVTLRTRRDGDRFMPPGLGGHTKKLNRWLADQKVPLRLRDRIPLLVVNGAIAAVLLPGGWIVSAGFLPPQPGFMPARYIKIVQNP